MKNIRTKCLVAIAGFSLSCFSAIAADPYCVVKGKIEGVTKSSRIIVQRNGGDHGATVRIQQAVMRADGTFQFALPEAVCHQLYDVRIEGTRSAFSFVAEKGQVEVAGDVKKLYMAQVGGTPENERWNDYQRFQFRQTRISNEMNMSGDQYSQEERIAIFDRLQAESRAYTDSLVNNYPNSIVALYLAKVPLPMMKHPRIDSVLQVFAPHFSKHPYYLEMKKRADILRRVAPGAIAPDFNVLQPDGKSKIALSSFRGKYVMLDFWASWCVPCRAENPHTKHLYEKYHSRGLEVISFSLDHEIAAWKEAIAKDGMTWRNASDLVGGLKSPVAKKYGIDGIPAIWIIDPQGKIIAEGIRGEALEALLASIFSQEPKQ